MVTPSGYVALQRIQEHMVVTMWYLMKSKNRDALFEDGIENASFVITVCHHLASFETPNSDPQDRYFYATSHSG